MSDIAHEMLRMFGLSMGIDVSSDQRVQKIREIREQEMQASSNGRRRWAQEPTIVLQQPRPRKRAIKGSTTWFPFKSKADR